MVYIEALKEESEGVKDEEKEKVAWLVITLLQMWVQFIGPYSLDR